MLTLIDIDAIEKEYEEGTSEDYYLAIQRAINAGAWQFQGSYGREMMRAIEAGFCMLGRDQWRDYYGNLIPSRDDIKQGTKGSYQFVIDNNGLEWADLMLEA